MLVSGHWPMSMLRTPQLVGSLVSPKVVERQHKSIPSAITRYENSQIEGYLDFFPIVYYRTPPKSLGCSYCPIHGPG
jgi:hypothetical protein